MSKYLEIGKSVKLIRNKFSGETQEFHTKVSDLEGEDIFVLDTPVDKNGFVMFVLGTKLTMEYKFGDSGINYLDVEVMERVKGRAPVLKVKKISKVENKQRRNFYRVNASVDVELRKKKDIITEYTTTSDISAGGLKLSTNQEFHVDDIVLVRFFIYDKLIDVQGKVVKIDKCENSISQISVFFLDITQVEQDAIVKFIFEKQREFIKKRI